MKWNKKYKFLKLLCNILHKYGWYSRKMCERDGIDTIADNDVISRLNEKITEKVLDHKYLPEITIKYHSNHGKHRYEIGNKSQNNTTELQ